MIDLFKDLYRGKSITIHCDNTTAVSNLIYKRVAFKSDNYWDTANLIKYIALISIKYNISQPIVTIMKMIVSVPNKYNTNFFI